MSASFADVGAGCLRGARLFQPGDAAEKPPAPMMASRRGHAVRAFACGTAWFACCTLLASLSPLSSQLLLGISITTLGVVAVLVLTRLLGVGCGMAAGVAGVVALDWYCIPPVHDHGLPDAQSTLVLVAYLVTGALLGELAAETRRRATESEGQARALASEQAALRRVATLIAAESCPDRVFEAVTQEVGELLDLDLSALLRYESDGTATVTGGWSRIGPQPPSGSRWALSRDGRTPLDAWMEQVGARSSVRSPVVVHGSLWGVIVGGSVADKPLVRDTEVRLGDFTELVATAVANADSRHLLAASRARVVISGDQARQRIERDLHDGVQQRLISLALDVGRVEAVAGRSHVDLHEQLEGLRVGLVSAIDDLREITQGIHPSILSEGGLRPALATLARRSPVPVELTVRGIDRVPDPVEICLYYVVSEALTNTLKHAQATSVSIHLARVDSAVELAFRDDGVGGADIRAGSGLVGVVDRLESVGGEIEVRSPVHQGTCLEVRVPLATGTTDEPWPPPGRSGPVNRSQRG